MQIDLYAKSHQLLETLANAVHDREQKLTQPFFFNIDEIQVAEKWLVDFIRELKEDCV